MRIKMEKLLINIEIEGIEKIMKSIDVSQRSLDAFGIKRNLQRFSGKFLVLENNMLVRSYANKEIPTIAKIYPSLEEGKTFLYTLGENLQFARGLGKEVTPEIIYFDKDVKRHEMYFFRRGPLGFFEPVNRDPFEKGYYDSEENDRRFEAACNSKLP